MLIRLANYGIKDILIDFNLNLTLLNEIIYAVAPVIRPVAITHKENNFKLP